MRITLFVFALLFALPNFSYSQNQDSGLTTFILIRHAEKGKDDPRDPSLNNAGLDRAENLAKMLSSTTIDAVFSTPYKRTRETVQGLAGQKYVEVKQYDPRDEDAISKLVKEYRGKTVVISGHSNTTPFYVNKLAGTEFEQLGEDEYDKIFIVTLKKAGKGTVTVLTY